MAKCLNSPAGGVSLNVSFVRYATSTALLADTPTGTKPVIGFVSSTDMTDYPQFSETDPTKRSDGTTNLSGGEIYVSTGRQNSRTFSIINGRKVNINPQAVYQHSGSAWVALVAYIWLGSAWALITPDTFYLYNAGTEGVTWIASTSYADFNLVSDYSAGTATKQASTLLFGDQANLFVCGGFKTAASAVDLTDYSVLRVVVASIASGSGGNAADDSRRIDVMINNTIVHRTNNASAGYTADIDISAYNGSYAIKVVAYSGSQISYTQACTVSEISLRVA